MMRPDLPLLRGDLDEIDLKADEIFIGDEPNCGLNKFNLD
jgi:hypothetical protein